MTRNIEINYLNSSGYDLLYPKAIDSNTEVDAIIKEILSLPESDMLDDVLLNMVLPDNKYAVALTVKTPGGRPFNGASVSGITSYVGEALTTDENGYVLGFCDTSTPTVTVTNPFLDVSGNVVQQLNLSGKVINSAEMKAVRNEVGQITFDAGNKTIQFSQDVEEFDCSAIGGGDDGEKGSYTSTRATGGRGGNAGQIVNSANNINTSQKIEVVIGQKGENSSVEGILTAIGGYSGGGAGGWSDDNTYSHGGKGADSGSFLYPPTAVGGAGGGGGSYYLISSPNTSAGGEGGSPGGGAGGAYRDSGANGTAKGSGGGGGGARFVVQGTQVGYDGGSGQPGLVGFMWRYKPDL